MWVENSAAGKELTDKLKSRRPVLFPPVAGFAKQIQLSGSLAS
jgi:hypothetical protein